MMEYKPGVERWVCTACKQGEPVRHNVIWREDEK